MSLRFSKVTLASENRRTEFLVGGIPKRCADLNGWTAFEKFIDDTPLYQTVRVFVQTFLYGGEEPVDATPEEIAYLNKRTEMRSDFIETRTEKIGKTRFRFINM
ncbi:MAG: hypothetical protein IJU41_00690 [Clostridia bacterium]|jgi:hypothetical protein|nr:hypothetical protein [Clostridia bacterium]MBQ9428038.1 hypothetical protein [Clostridia bacterium]